jgi:hypothetical protein
MFRSKVKNRFSALWRAFTKKKNGKLWNSLKKPCEQFLPPALNVEDWYAF